MSSSTDKPKDLAWLLETLGPSGVEGSAEIVKAILNLIGNMIQAVGVAAASVDPLQFAFVVGTTLFVLNYLDQTEPYATIIRTTKFHNLIKYLHMPGTSAQDIVAFQQCVTDSIKVLTDAGVPVPPGLYQLKDSSNVLGVAVGFENLIPGAGLLDSTLTGIFNGAGISTSAQLLSQLCPALKTYVNNLKNNYLGYGPNGPQPPPTSGGPPVASGVTITKTEWTYIDLGSNTRQWFTDVNTAIGDPGTILGITGSGWSRVNSLGLAGNLVEVTYYSDGTRRFRVIKYAPLHSDVDNPANASFQVPKH